MRKDYDAWVGSFSEEERVKLTREEGWPWARVELISFFGKVNFGRDFLESQHCVVPISGHLRMFHPSTNDYVNGSLISHRGESFVEGVLKGDSFEFIEGYVMLHSESYNTTYRLKREGSLWVGDFESNDPNSEKGKISVELSSRGFFHNRELVDIKRPYIERSLERSQAVLDFLRERELGV